MGLVSDIRRRHIGLMGKTLDILGNTLKFVTQEQAVTLREGEDGWTVLEVLCHLRDYDLIFLERARHILRENFPILPAYDHDQMAIERRYNMQNLTQVYVDLVKSRREMIDFFDNLSGEEWNRAGQHPDRGYFTLTDAVVQVSHHDIGHIEQITRILSQLYDGSSGLTGGTTGDTSGADSSPSTHLSGHTPPDSA